MTINKAILIGRVGKDPDIRTIQGDREFATFSIATSKKYKDKANQIQEKTQWHYITIWMPSMVKYVKEYLKKGAMIYVTGEIEYSEQNGKYSTSIVAKEIRFLDNPNYKKTEIKKDDKVENNTPKLDPVVEDEILLSDEIPF